MWEVFERLCKAHGVTPYRVSEATGIKTSSLSGWKAGRYNLKTEKLKKIADYFGVSIEYLMTGEEPEEKEGYYVNPETADMAQELYVHLKPFLMLPNPSAYMRFCRVNPCFFEPTHQLCVLRQKNNILQKVLQSKTPWEAVSQGAYPKGESMPVTAKK